MVNWREFREAVVEGNMSKLELDVMFMHCVEDNPKEGWEIEGEGEE